MPQHDTRPEPDHQRVEDTVLDLLAEILYVERDTVRSDTEFTAQGLDSILAVEYLAQVHEALGVKVTLEELHDLGTPGALAARVRQAPAGTGAGHAPHREGREGAV
ncbi:acyl carrier protein [Streptomyces longwoodensis]|uniref:acyl carrier protein n=1 Tax=Streptomyces longwoodensis TaxID=68231 RepID=UPI0033C8DAA7